MQTRSGQHGFTLLEVLLAIAITASVMMTIGTAFNALLGAREVIDELSESTEAGPRILNLIERDLRGIWTFNVYNNAVFRGRDMDVGSFEADRMDFLTTTDAVGYVLDSYGQPKRPSLCEVGYWFKQNPRYRDLIEMWRREDPLVDGDLLTQGSFQLVHDRIKKFSVTYYDELGYEAEEKLEWDSAQDDKLPRRIKIEFTIERRRGSRNVVNDAEIDDFEAAEKTYVRHFVFDRNMSEILRGGSAMVPVLPNAPTGQAGSEGAMQGQGPQGAQGGAGGPVTVQTSNGGPIRGDGQVTELGGAGRGGGRGGTRPTGGGNRPSTPQQLPQGFNINQILGGGGGNLGGLFGNR
ncbi:MAG: prepilin-type N-terminal cleavage/methylation domain-containing protein [Planctomycetes bacterium]|nr:prepilin-type N-terminal cleavage/methylation domain-containing protein [Planctomycetota bacterium]